MKIKKEEIVTVETSLKKSVLIMSGLLTIPMLFKLFFSFAFANNPSFYEFLTSDAYLIFYFYFLFKKYSNKIFHIYFCYLNKKTRIIQVLIVFIFTLAYFSAVNGIVFNFKEVQQYYNNIMFDKGLTAFIVVNFTFMLICIYYVKKCFFPANGKNVLRYYYDEIPNLTGFYAIEFKDQKQYLEFIAKFKSSFDFEFSDVKVNFYRIADQLRPMNAYIDSRWSLILEVYEYSNTGVSNIVVRKNSSPLTNKYIFVNELKYIGGVGKWHFEV